MRQARLLGFALLGAFIAITIANVVRAQDPLKIAPEIYKVALENERVRVLDVHLKAGGKSPKHSHPAYVAVAFTPCKVRFTLPDGKTREADMKPGDVVWSDPETHSVDNIGTGECHVLNIELKEAK